MKKKDYLIIAALRENSRETLAKISNEIHVPLSTIHDRIKALKETVIIKNTAIVDFAVLGYNTRACLLVKVEKKDRDDVQQHFLNCSHVNWLAKINNGHDFLVEVVFKHIKDMEDYLETLDNGFNLNIDVFYIIDDLKREGFLANMKTAKLLIK
jgi:DNA-binding Lrp family transcriptional regulator